MELRYKLIDITLKYRKDRDYYEYTFQDINGLPIYYHIVTATPNFSFNKTYTIDELRCFVDKPVDKQRCKNA